MQIGTSDGRVKLVGTSSTEATLTSPERHATVSLHSLPNTGCLLRLDTAGTLELWSIIECALEATLSAPASDTFTACEPLIHDPYVALGCASGALHIAAVLDRAGKPLSPARPAGTIKLTPLVATADALGVPEDTPVVSVQPREIEGAGLCVLVLHEWQGLTIYSVHKRSVRLILSLPG